MTDIQNPAPRVGGNRASGIEHVSNPPDTAPTRPAQARQTKLINWRPHRKGTLLGFVIVELPIGLQIADITIHRKDGRFWVSMPARPLFDTSGRPLTGIDGKQKYSAFLSWRDRDLSDRFSARVVELLRQKYPQALDESGHDDAGWQ
jgi:hypothetical protein